MYLAMSPQGNGNILSSYLTLFTAVESAFAATTHEERSLKFGGGRSFAAMMTQSARIYDSSATGRL